MNVLNKKAIDELERLDREGYFNSKWGIKTRTERLFYSMQAIDDSIEGKEVVLRDLAKYTQDGIIKYRQVGFQTMRTVKKMLEDNGLHLGMTEEEIEAIDDEEFYNDYEEECIIDSDEVLLDSLIKEYDFKVRQGSKVLKMLKRIKNNQIKSK